MKRQGIMTRITTGKRDIAWNYIGTFMSMAGSFLLLPLLIYFLTEEELGLWYVFIAVSSFANLLEFGFTPTFSRNIVYCVSGINKLSKQGFDSAPDSKDINWHLLRTVLRASKIVYAVIALVALLLSATIGTSYVQYISSGLSSEKSLTAWLIFIIAIFMNLYFLYGFTFLRGLGDIEGENKAKTFARIAQLALSAVLLFGGFGLIGASLGFLVNGLMMRVLSTYYFKRHKDIQEGMKSDKTPISVSEIKEVFSAIYFTAWRDGVVTVAWFGSTQAMTIICSLFLGLGETGTYSVMLQLATAVYSVASAYIRSFFPAWQAASVEHDTARQRSIVSRGISCYYAGYLIGTAAVILVVFPLLPFIRSSFVVDIPLYLGLSAYVFLLNQHSIFCSLIVGTNRIPYFKGYIFAAIVGIVLSSVFCGVFQLGAWGLVLGQALPQLAYNNWKWPHFVLKELNTNIKEMLRDGFIWWKSKLAR